MTTQQKEVVQAIQKMKDSEFGLTGVKVELEAVFDRDSMPGSRINCPTCEGNEYVPCTHCDREGCEECDFDGDIECPDCNGAGEIANELVGTNFHDMSSIHDTILEKLVPLGLARPLEEGGTSQYSHKYKVKYPMVHSHVYADATVDTEMTFTLSMENPKTVLLLPDIIRAFTSLSEETGTLRVDDAGMHISLLSHPNNVYPADDDPTDDDYLRYSNFKKSMTLLLPALYLLATHSQSTRKLGYRRPYIGANAHGDAHYNAIHYGYGALEFRIFDTCYDNPEQILDNLIVMSKCMKFWTFVYTRNFLDRVTKQIRFGYNGGGHIDKFYVLNEHLELLNRGLKLIKPDYLSIAQIKKARNFTVTKQTVGKLNDELKLKVKNAYKEYEKRFQWDCVLVRNNYINRYIHDNVEGHRPGELSAIRSFSSKQLHELEERAEAEVKKFKREKMKEKEYYPEALKRLGNIGDYELCVE